MGKNRHETAGTSWRKLASWLAGRVPDAGPVSPSDSLPPVAFDGDAGFAELAKKLREPPKTMRSYRGILTQISVMTAEGHFDRALKKVEVLEKLAARGMKALALERLEKAAKRVRALEILTPAEAELLRVHREKLAGPPLKPGEAVPPPIEDGSDGRS